MPHTTRVRCTLSFGMEGMIHILSDCRARVKPGGASRRKHSTTNLEHPTFNPVCVMKHWRLAVPYLLLRILPDPVAVDPVFIARFIFGHNSAVIFFIPADGINQEFFIVRATIMQRLAADRGAG